MREVATTTPPQRAMAPPLRPVPAPRATTGTPCFRADWTGLHLGGGVGEDDGIGQGAVDGAVVLVEQQVVRVGEEPGLADDATEVGQEGGGGGRLGLGYRGHGIRHATAHPRRWQPESSFGYPMRS